MATDRALNTYSNAMRHGSLLEFLALRPSHAVGLQLAVVANIRRDAASLAELSSYVGDMNSRATVVLPPLSEREGAVAAAAGRGGDGEEGE